MATRIRLQRHGRKSYAFYNFAVLASTLVDSDTN